MSLNEIEQKLKSAEDVDTILNFSCETLLYTDYTPGDKTAHMDYDIISKCYHLLGKYEKSYYENYIETEPKEKYPIPDSFQDEYEQYKSNILVFIEYLTNFEETDVATATADNCDNTDGTDDNNCGSVSEKEYYETMGKPMSYEDYEEMKIEQIEWKRENMKKDIEKYKKILKSMKN